jgi:hypothetical protein
MTQTAGTDILARVAANSGKSAGAGVASEADPAKSGQEPVALWQLVFSFPAMLGTLLVAIVYVVKRGFEVDPDFWWHLKSGEAILATHHWPTTDPYSFTVVGQRWMAYEWLGDVTFATFERIGGLRGLAFLMIALGAATMVALYILAAVRCGNSKAGFITSLALLVLVVPILSLRPQMFGYLFLILTLLALELFRQGKRGAVWFLPPLFLVWINTHGSWVLGLGTILVYWVSGLKEFRIGAIEARRWTPPERLRLALVFLLCVAVLPITPYGTRLVAFPFEVAGSYPISHAHVNEWLPMPFNLPGGKAFLVLALGLFALQIAFEFTWRLEDCALLFFGTFMAFLHIRFLLAFVPFCAPLLAIALARWVPRYERKKDLYLVNAALMLVFVVAMVRYFPTQSKIQETIANHFPVDAVQFMGLHSVPEPIFNSYGFGGYLIWSRGPQHKVFIDGRTEPYEERGVYSDYLKATLLEPGGFDVLRKYGIQSCVLEHNEPLANVLVDLPEWQRVYVDQNAAIFVRRGGVDGMTANTKPVADTTAAVMAAGGARLFLPSGIVH